MLRRILLDCFGGGVNTKDGAGYTKLHHAAKDGQYEEVRRLVERGAHLNIRDNAGRTALMVAASIPYSCIPYRDIVKYLHQAGADINIRTNGGSTAMIETARMGQGDIVQYLHQAGADINIRDKDGSTALIVDVGSQVWTWSYCGVSPQGGGRHQQQEQVWLDTSE